MRPNVNAGANVPTGNVTGNIGFSRPMSAFNHNNDNPGANGATGPSIEADLRLSGMSLNGGVGRAG